jgi:hypothetical protein
MTSTEDLSERSITMADSKRSKFTTTRRRLPGINECIDALSHEELATIVKRIVWLLYFNEEADKYEPDFEWDEETIESVAQVLVDHELVPKKRKKG